MLLAGDQRFLHILAARITNTQPKNHVTPIEQLEALCDLGAPIGFDGGS